MIPRSQHFRDRAPFPLLGSGIVRIFKEAVLERLLCPARSRAHYAGKQPNASIEKHERGRLSARKHDIADGDFLYAAICNDFMELRGRADDDNLRNLPALAAFLYNEVPMALRGAEKYAAWVKGCAERRAQAMREAPL